MKKKILEKLPVAITAVICCLMLLVVYFTQEKTFMFIENAGLFRDKADLKEVDEPTVREKTISELQSAKNVILDQSLMLINTVYMLDDSFIPSVSEYKDTTVFMNDCVLDAFASLSASVKEKFGQKLYVSSDLRDSEEQKELYENDPTTATIPGASEHQSGLALDVYAAYYAGDAFLKSPIGRYVNSHCHEYGFIIRYPSYGEDITGIRFEPWHIRYVGEPHAKIIYGNMLTLEEYILSLELNKWYSYDGYLISRQSADNGSLRIPEEYESCVISPDNTGAYIVTIKEKNAFN